MTATDELRRLLDERGVEYETDDTQVDGNGTMYQVTYVKEGYARTWVYEEPPDCDLLVSYNLDLGAEDAIAATLGRGECKVDVLNTGDCAGYECSEYIMHCNGCGHEFGHVLYNEDGDVWMSEPPNYCPNCGRRVVDPTTNDVDAEVAR